MAKDSAAMLAALGGLKKPKGEASEVDDEAEGEELDELEPGDPVDEAFDALKADDREAFRDAFNRAVMACMSSEEEY
jgi:hypothetical protein